MGRVSSDNNVAESATIGFDNITQGSLKTVSLVQSNLSGMKSGAKVANQMLSDLKHLTSCVKSQASKFKQLASVREELDATTDQNMFKPK